MTPSIAQYRLGSNTSLSVAHTLSAQLSSQTTTCPSCLEYWWALCVWLCRTVKASTWIEIQYIPFAEAQHSKQETLVFL